MTTFKNISDGEYMRDKISCLRSYFNNFSTLLHVTHCMNTCTPVLIHTGKVGVDEPVRRLEGAPLHKRGRKYHHD
jgi:hypothetical protein